MTELISFIAERKSTPLLTSLRKRLTTIEDSAEALLPVPMPSERTTYPASAPSVNTV